MLFGQHEITNSRVLEFLKNEFLKLAFRQFVSKC